MYREIGRIIWRSAMSFATAGPAVVEGKSFMSVK